MSFKQKAIVAAVFVPVWGLIGFGLVSAENLSFSGSFNIGTTQTGPNQTGPNQTGAGNTATASSIAIDRAQLTNGPVQGYRSFQPLRGNVVTTGTPFNIYVEPTGLATRFQQNGAGGTVSAAMTIDLEIRDAAGAVVAAQPAAWKVPVSAASPTHRPLSNVYVSLPINHLTFADGRYRIQLRVHDDLGAKFVDRAIDIELRTATAASVTR